jgi:hypothetical protein
MKNGKVIKLTESDLQRIVKRVLNEELPPIFTQTVIPNGGNDKCKECLNNVLLPKYAIKLEKSLKEISQSTGKPPTMDDLSKLLSDDEMYGMFAHESKIKDCVKQFCRGADNEKAVSKTLKCCRDARLPDSQIPKSCKEGNVERCKKDLFASNPKTNEKYIAISCIDDGKNNLPSHHPPTR